MSSRSTRSRLSDHGRSLVELYDAGTRWEGLRAIWFSSHGNNAMAQDCLGRQAHFERELRDLL